MNFDQLVDLCRKTHEQLLLAANRSIDTHLVARNFLFGLYIVQFEQEGADRARYGKRTLKELSNALKSSASRGFSVDNLELMRRFYLEYRSAILHPSISETPSRKSLSDTPGKSETLSRISADAITANFSGNELISQLPRHFALGWSHYVELLTIDGAEERRFYEIEAAANQWSVRELQRQIASSLYQRLALSRDKDEIRRLASEGQVVEKAADLVKNPLVLEFLGLADHPSYSEDDLESAIISQLESFLLELGKGFLFEARQKRFTFDNDHFRVDLVFYNRLLRCYVLIDLKRDKLTHQDLGQMQIHPMRYEIPLCLHFEKLGRQQLLCRLHKRSQAPRLPAPSRSCSFYKRTIANRSRLLRSMPEPSRCNEARKVSQNRMGQKIHKIANSRLSHGVNVNYFDRHVKLPDESPTVGILLCHRKNDALVELTLPPDTNIFASKYQLYLPTKEEFKARLESITTSLDDSRHADR